MSESQSRRQRIRTRHQDQIAEHRKEIASWKEQICNIQKQLRDQTQMTEKAEFGKKQLLILNKSLLDDLKTVKYTEKEIEGVMQVCEKVVLSYI